jgi:hypothetical protein
VRVESYAGRIAGERPQFAFGWTATSTWSRKCSTKWYGPEDVFFKVRADNRNVYILRHETPEPEGSWELVSFRKFGQP